MKRVSFLLSIILLSSCAGRIEITNEEVCTELTDEKAYCKYSLSNDERIVQPDKWRIMRVGRVSLSGDAYARLKTQLERACTSNPKSCDVSKVKQAAE
jgi:hypothetical protein